MSATEWSEIESLGRKFTKLKESDKRLVRLIIREARAGYVIKIANQKLTANA